MTAPAPAEETVDVLTRGCQAAEDRARRRATAPLMRVDARRIRSVLSRLAAVERERDEWKSLYMLAVEEGQQQINEKRAVEARAGGGPMTADVDQMRRWLAVATGREVAGNGVAERIWRAHEARQRLTDALPALLDELEHLRGITARLVGEREDASDRAEDWDRVVIRPEQMSEWFTAYGVQLMTVGEDGDWVALGHVEPLRMIAAMRKAARKHLRLDDEDVFGSRSGGWDGPLAVVEHLRAYFTEHDECGWYAHWGDDAQQHRAAVDVTVWRV